MSDVDSTEDLYRRTLAYWPESVDVRERKLHATGGATSPALVAAHDDLST